MLKTADSIVSILCNISVTVLAVFAFRFLTRSEINVNLEAML